MISSPGPTPKELNLEWQSGQDRALLYLRLLGVPGVESLEITLEAMRRARAQAGESRGACPVNEVMRALRRVLEERAAKTGSASEGCIVPICAWPSLPEQLGIPGETRSMPPLNRGTMLPEHR
jgi:hypothetical protein